MRITFKQIEIHNFMAFADEVFDFSANKGMNLICGKNNDIPGSTNGCGKTQLSEALCFALYGQTRNNIKNSNIWNKFIGTKEMRITLYFSVGKNEYVVSSGFNKHGSPYCKLARIDDGNEEDLTKSSIAETRKFLQNEILHCDMSLFLRTTVLSSDQIYNFFRLSKSEKKDFIEKLFDISLFGNMYASIHHDVLQLDKQINIQQNKLVVLNNQLESNKERAATYEINNKNKLEEIKSKIKTLSEEKEKLSKRQVEYNQAEAKKYTDALTTIATYTSQIQTKINNIEAEIKNIKIQQTTLESENKKLKLNIDKHKDLLDKLCNDCKPIFMQYYSISEYKSKIDDNVGKIARLQQEIDENSQKIQKHKEQLELLLSKKELASKKLKDLTSEHDAISKKLIDIQYKIDFANTEIDNIKNSTNPYSDAIESLEIEVKTETSTLDNQAERYKYLKHAENIVSQDTIRKFIIKDLVGILNNKIKTYLMKLGSDYDAIFDSEMNYKLIAKSSKTEYEYDNFSAGERARLMIASCFSFRDFMSIRNNLSCNILIIDEFIDGAIDSLAIESILKILESFKNMFKQNIYIISHRKDIDNDVFDNVIQIVKTNHISKITYVSQ